eukprot:6866255-Prymnesium_polylepis.1
MTRQKRSRRCRSTTSAGLNAKIAPSKARSAPAIGGRNEATGVALLLGARRQRIKWQDEGSVVLTWLKYCAVLHVYDGAHRMQSRGHEGYGCHARPC